MRESASNDAARTVVNHLRAHTFPHAHTLFETPDNLHNVVRALTFGSQKIPMLKMHMGAYVCGYDLHFYLFACASEHTQCAGYCRKLL